jgi:uncharacterized protein (TIGR02118 family)
MIDVIVLYRNTETLKFNMNYYLGTHIPLVHELLGGALKHATVQQGLGGAVPGSKAEFAVICRLGFDSVEAFQTAFGPHAAAVQGDVVNFCNEPPIVQVSDVRVV